MPRAVHGDEWSTRGFGGVSPQSYEAFSLEEAPTFGRGSSLKTYMKLGIVQTARPLNSDLAQRARISTSD